MDKNEPFLEAKSKEWETTRKSSSEGHSNKIFGGKKKKKHYEGDKILEKFA